MLRNALSFAFARRARSFPIHAGVHFLAGARFFPFAADRTVGACLTWYVGREEGRSPCIILLTRPPVHTTPVNTSVALKLCDNEPATAIAHPEPAFRFWCFRGDRTSPWTSDRLFRVHLFLCLRATWRTVATSLRRKFEFLMLRWYLLQLVMFRAVIVFVGLVIL